MLSAYIVFRCRDGIVRSSLESFHHQSSRVLGLVLFVERVAEVEVLRLFQHHGKQIAIVLLFVLLGHIWARSYLAIVMMGGGSQLAVLLCGVGRRSTGKVDSLSRVRMLRIPTLNAISFESQSDA